MIKARQLTYCFLVFLGVLWAALSAHAQTSLEQIQNNNIFNLTSNEEADRWADAYAARIARINAEDPDAKVGTKENPIVMFHVHKTFSEYVNRALTRLVDKKVYVKSNLVDPDEIIQDVTSTGQMLDPDGKDFMGLGAMADQPASEPLPESPQVKERGLLGKIGQKVKYMLSIPNGFSLWIPVAQNQQQKRTANKLACINATLAACSISLSFYVGHRAMPTIIGAAASLWVWVWANLYWFRSVQEVMAQGKSLKVRDGEILGIRRSIPFLWTSNFVRGLLTNAFILTGISAASTVAAVAHAIMTGDLSMIVPALMLIFSKTAWKVTLINAVVNTFARSQVDKLLTEITPLPSDPPDAPGKVSVTTAGRLRNLWEFLYGFVKNLDLARKNGATNEAPTWNPVKIAWNYIKGSRATEVYSSMVAINLAWMVWDFKDALKDKKERWFEKMRGESTHCEIALYARKASLDLAEAATTP